MASRSIRILARRYGTGTVPGSPSVNSVRRSATNAAAVAKAPQFPFPSTAVDAFDPFEVEPLTSFPPPRRQRRRPFDELVDPEFISERYRMPETSERDRTTRTRQALASSHKLPSAEEDVVGSGFGARLPFDIPGLSSYERRFVADQLRVMTLLRAKMLSYAPQKDHMTKTAYENQMDLVREAWHCPKLHFTARQRKPVFRKSAFKCPMSLRRTIVALRVRRVMRTVDRIPINHIPFIQSYDVPLEDIVEDSTLLVRPLCQLSDQAYVANRLGVPIAVVARERRKLAMRGIAVRDHIADLGENLGRLGLSPHALKTVRLGNKGLTYNELNYKTTWALLSDLLDTESFAEVAVHLRSLESAESMCSTRTLARYVVDGFATPSDI